MHPCTYPGEDVVNFLVFKRAERQRKSELFMQIMLDPSIKSKNITFEHMMQCIKEPWEEAFSPANNKKAWSRIGVFPFTRAPYWKLKLRETRMEKLAGDKVIFGDVTLASCLPFKKSEAQRAAAAGAGDGSGEGAGAGVFCSQQLFATGPVTDDVAFEHIKEKTQKRQLEVTEAAERKVKRVQKQQQKSEEGCQLLHSGKQVSSMTGDQLDKVAAFKNVKFTAGQRVDSKKAQIQALLADAEPTVAQ